jgi:hypothetical protein
MQHRGWRDGSFLKWVTTSSWSLVHRVGSVSAVADTLVNVVDRLRAEMVHRVGLSDLLNPARLV